MDGGFVSLEEGGLSYGFKTSTGLITIIDNTTKSAITVPYKDFFQCSGLMERFGEEEEHF